METKGLQKVIQKVFLPSNFQILLESIPQGNNVLLMGPPGIGKTIFCENLIDVSLKNDIPCVYVTIDTTPNEVKNNFVKSGVKFDENKIIFIDGYTWLIGKSNEKYHIENLSNLTELNFRIISASSAVKKPFLLVFDSVSPLSLYNPENFVLKFLQLLLAKVKEWEGVGVYVVQEGVHSSEFYNTISYLVDGIFDMKRVEEEDCICRLFRVRSISSASHETKWMPFKIESDRSVELILEEKGKK